MAFTDHHYLLIFSLCILYMQSAQAQLLCNQNSNTSTTETIKNIDSVLTKLVQATPKSGYSVTAFGSGESRVFGLGQCRGDVSLQDCSTCIQNNVKEIKTACPNRVDARLWYDQCFVRYSTKSFFAQVDVGFGTYFLNPQNATDPKTFNAALTALVNQTNNLASGPQGKGSGIGETKVSDSVTLYAASQCTRDLPPSSCAICLEIAVGDLSTYCQDKQGCRVIYNSCYIRYEVFRFF